MLFYKTFLNFLKMKLSLNKTDTVLADLFVVAVGTWITC